MESLLCFLALPCLLLILSVWVLRRRRQNLSGRHVLVTGGSSGIGRSLALLAAKQGAAVVTIVARNEERLRRTAAEIEGVRLGVKARWIAVDLASCPEEEVRKKLLKCDGDEEAGPVYLVVNCAGAASPARFEDTPESAVEAQMAINYFAAVKVTRILLPQLKSTQGRVAFVSSQAGLVGLFGYTAYAASKFALRGFAEALEMEVRPFGVGVTVSFPPDTDTPGFVEEEKGKPEETRMISQAAGLFHPDDVAKSILNDVLDGRFHSSPGLDGWVLTNLNSGMTDGSFLEMLIQVAVMGPLRLVGWCYKQYFHYIVSRCNRSREAAR